MSELIKCSRGFLIERREDGTFAPFFIKVRSQDIIWKDGDEGGGGGGGQSSSAVTVSDIDGWTVTKYKDEYYTATKAISVDDVYFYRDIDDTKLIGEIALPLSIISAKYFNANVGVNGANDAIATSHVNVAPVIGETSRITSLKITIRNLVYTFPSNWTEDESYENSKLYITVSGRLNI